MRYKGIIVFTAMIGSLQAFGGQSSGGGPVGLQKGEVFTLQEEAFNSLRLALKLNQPEATESVDADFFAVKDDAGNVMIVRKAPKLEESKAGPATGE
jgi:hypothetical protein